MLLQENNKLSSMTEAQEIIYSEVYDNDMYHIDNISIDYKKYKLEWSKCVFE